MTTDVLIALRSYLISRGVAAPVYLQHRPPDAADTCLVLRDYGDAPGPPWVTDGRLQVVIRGPQADVKAAKDLAAQVHAILHPPGANPNVVVLTVAGQDREIRISHLSGPFDLAQDEAGRFEFSVNYRVEYEATAWPSGLTFNPDPVQALRSWTTGKWPNLQVDPATWRPSDVSPGVYWRLATLEGVEPTNWGAWISGRFQAHILAPTPSVRLEWMRRIVEGLALSRRAPLGDGSPLYFQSISANSEADYIRDGQIRLTARFGILPTAAGGQTLLHAYLGGAVSGEVT